MTDFKNINDIANIKKQRFGGKDVENADKDYFFGHSLVNSEIEKARQVAVLLDKVMKAESKTEKGEFDKSLLEDLRKEKNTNSLAFQVLESKTRGEGTVGYVTNAIYGLNKVKGKNGEMSTLDEIDQDIESLKSALDEKSDLADLKKITDDFDPIKRKIEELRKKSSSYDGILNYKMKRLAELKSRNETLEARKNTTEFKQEMTKYNTYETMVKGILSDFSNDASIKKSNKLPVNISSLGKKGEVTVTQLQNSLFFLLKEVIEKIEVDKLQTYLGKSGLKAKYNKVKRGIEMLAKVNDAKKYPQKNSKGEYLKDASGNIVFKNREGEERKMWEPGTHKIKEGRAEGKIDYNDVVKKDLDNKVFPYEECLDFISTIFPHQYINSVNDDNIKALKDEDANPLKKSGLLNKEYKWVFAFSGNRMEKSWRNAYGDETYEDSYKRENIEWSNLQDLLKTFYEFFTPQNRSSLISDWKSQRWGFLTGGDVSSGTTHPFLPGELDYTKWTDKQLMNPAELINEEVAKNGGEILVLETEVQSVAKLQTSDELIKELAKLPEIQKRLEEFKKNVYEKLLKKAREYYGNGDFKKMTRKKIWDIISFFELAEKRGKLESTDKEAFNNAKAMQKRISKEAPAWTTFYVTRKSFEERIKEFSATQAKQLEEQWKKVGELIDFDSDEKEDYQKLVKAIGRLNNGEKWEDIVGSSAPSPALNEEVLEAIFGFTVDSTLLSKWKKIDDKDISEEIIKGIFDDYVGDNTKLAALASHVRDRGVEGVDNSKISETNDKKLLEKFLKEHSATAVVKTIVVHENDDALKDNPDAEKKKAIIKDMRDDTNAGYNATDLKENKFDKERYGNPTEGEEDNVTREQLLNYLFDKKIKNVKQSNAWGTNEENGKNGGNRFLNHLKANWPWYALATVGVLVLLAVFFWKNISEWWNGPAEEQGEGKVDEGKEEEEE